MFHDQVSDSFALENAVPYVPLGTRVSLQTRPYDHGTECIWCCRSCLLLVGDHELKRGDLVESNRTPGCRFISVRETKQIIDLHSVSQEAVVRMTVLPTGSFEDPLI